MSSKNRDWPPPLFLIPLVLWLAVAGRLAAAETGPAMHSATLATGRLKVEGDTVEQVILAKLGNHDTFDPKSAVLLRRPMSRTAIPTGEYVVIRIDLKGGYSYVSPGAIITGEIGKALRGAERLTIRPGKPCVLKVGLPLTPILVAGRLGRVIQIVYELHDVQGRPYFALKRDKPPRFTMWCDNREVGSGPLAYGLGTTSAHSWRVPLSVVSGPLRVVASEDLAGLGHVESQPVLVEWHWYDHLPSFAGWVLIGALCVLVKENRHQQALTILLPFFLLSEVLWPWIAYLFALLSVDTRPFSYPYQWLVVAWTAVWLAGPWLARVRPALGIVLALVLAALVGLVAEFGLWQNLYFGPPLMNYAVMIFALLLAFVFSALCCRHRYTPRLFLAWLVPGLLVGVAVGSIGSAIWLYANLAGAMTLPPVPVLLLGMMVFSLCLAGCLYLLNLPFLYLVLYCPLYQERFHAVLRLPEYVPPTETEEEIAEEEIVDEAE